MKTRIRRGVLVGILAVVASGCRGTAATRLPPKRLESIEAGMTLREADKEARSKLHFTEFLDFDRTRRIYFDQDWKGFLTNSRVSQRVELAIGLNKGRVDSKSWRTWERMNDDYVLTQSQGGE